MNLSVGIVGLPNVGKSTLFNALLKKQTALVANYPFATIEPNIGVVAVPDERLDVLAKIVNTDKITPATINFVDIAGLVAGANEGEGLGNKFLAHIREADLICEVIRFFPDPEIHHVEGKIDPVRDREILETELILADLKTLENQKFGKHNLSKEEQVLSNIIDKLSTELNQGQLAREVLNSEELKLISHLHLLTAKPILYIANVAEEDLGKTELPSGYVEVSAKVEQDLAVLSDDDRAEYLSQLGLSMGGLERVAQKAYELLDYISFLTAGVIEARAWKIRKGTTAPQAAGEIHTDFIKKFIKAEVVSYADFVELGGWKNSREAGKARIEGKDYIVKDGDVVDFKIAE